IFRRCIHLAMVFVPLLYYHYAPRLSALGISPRTLLLIILAVVFIFEALRLRFGWILWGQRTLEKKTVSSMASGILGLCLVLLFSPSSAYAIPIIGSCAIVDPLVGELRNTRIPRVWIWIIGMAAVALIWWGSGRIWPTIPWLWAVMAPLTVILERPNIPWID